MQKLFVICSIFFVLLAGCVQNGTVDSKGLGDSGATGFTMVEVSSFKLQSDGNLYLTLKNNAGGAITINYINATLKEKNEKKDASLNIKLDDKATSTELNPVRFSSTINSGDSYAVDLVIGYTTDELGFDYTETGYIYGTVQ